MKTLGHALALAALSACAITFSGCATTQFTKTADSAYVKGIDSLLFKRERVYIARIDGLATAPEFFGLNIGNYVSPGKHELAIVWDYQGAIGVETVEVDLAANHTYQFNISAGTSVMLEDETVKPGTSFAIVGSWELHAAEYDEQVDAEPIADVSYDDAHHSRPPFHPGEPGGGDKHGPPPGHPGGPGGGGNHPPPPGHPGGSGGGGPHTPPPTHSGGGGGPPSIPSTPRSNPGGGGGGSSGGHSSGGSSGGSSSGGGHSSGGSSGGNSGGGGGGDHKKG